MADSGLPPPSRAMLAGVEIAYVDAPPAAGSDVKPTPVLLIHGFASNRSVNWIATTWTGTLTRAGYRVIALDNRGHGESTKLYRPEEYHTSLMAEDAVGLLDSLGIGRAHVMGYSMGARISAFVALARPERVATLLMGGLGIHLVEGVGLPAELAEAMEAPSLAAVSDPMGQMFRAFAERTGGDLRALAACIRGSRQTLPRQEVSRIAAPALISVGTRDPIAGSAAELAALMPNARALDIPGRDHNLAVGDRVHKEGVLAFLAGHE